MTPPRDYVVPNSRSLWISPEQQNWTSINRQSQGQFILKKFLLALRRRWTYGEMGWGNVWKDRGKTRTKKTRGCVSVGGAGQPRGRETDYCSFNPRMGIFRLYVATRVLRKAVIPLKKVPCWGWPCALLTNKYGLCTCNSRGICNNTNLNSLKQSDISLLSEVCVFVLEGIERVKGKVRMGSGERSGSKVARLRVGIQGFWGGLG